MSPIAKQKVVIIGCGNLAWHLAKQLMSLKKYSITIYNHQANPFLSKFRTVLKCKTVIGLNAIADDASVYFICVSDSKIKEVAQKIMPKIPNALLLHTSGSAKLRDLGERINPMGVFYPLQTFSKEVDVNWTNIPIFIETANRDTEYLSLSLADEFSKQVYRIGSKDRLKMHLAAVLVNNFVNALYVSAYNLIHSDINNSDLSFELLLPIIEESTTKIKHVNPREAQTGPAKREDHAVMKKHLKLIKKDEELSKIYSQISKLILKQQKN